MSLDEHLTVLIPTSPIPRHPDTGLIEECIGSIRSYFPSAKILITADGVREQVAHRKEQYEEYKDNLGKLIIGKGNVQMMVCPEHVHQTAMTRNALEHHVHTPLVLFCEHDAVLRTNPGINFGAIFGLLLSGGANLVRFYAWPDVWHEHEYLMRGDLLYGGARFVKTVQFSGWPLVARKEHLQRVVNMIPPGEKTMIEPGVYYPVARSNWEDHKMVLYLDGSTVISHRDGRTDEKTGERDPAEW